ALFDLLRLFQRDLAVGKLFRIGDGAFEKKADRSLFGIELDLNIAPLADILLFIGGSKRRLERFDERLFADALFALKVGERRKEILVDHSYLLRFYPVAR